MRITRSRISLTMWEKPYPEKINRIFNIDIVQQYKLKAIYFQMLKYYFSKIWIQCFDSKTFKLGILGQSRPIYCSTLTIYCSINVATNIAILRLILLLDENQYWNWYCQYQYIDLYSWTYPCSNRRESNLVKTISRMSNLWKRF